MTDQQKEQLDTEMNRYRFSGYQLPMLQLDSTGAQYLWIPTPHPYYRAEPEWQESADALSPQDNIGATPSLYMIGAPNLMT